MIDIIGAIINMKRSIPKIILPLIPISHEYFFNFIFLIIAINKYVKGTEIKNKYKISKVK